MTDSYTGRGFAFTPFRDYQAEYSPFGLRKKIDERYSKVWKLAFKFFSLISAPTRPIERKKN